MTRTETIKKLSAELAGILNTNDNIEIIEKYIQYAIVTEIERLKGQINIYQKIDKKSGAVIHEYFGMDEIVSEFQNVKKPLTIKRLINGAIMGEKRSAYGFMWKRA